MQLCYRRITQCCKETVELGILIIRDDTMCNQMRGILFFVSESRLIFISVFVWLLFIYLSMSFMQQIRFCFNIKLNASEYICSAAAAKYMKSTVEVRTLSSNNVK
jgi:hypothetical protein